MSAFESNLDRISSYLSETNRSLSYMPGLGNEFEVLNRVSNTQHLTDYDVRRTADYLWSLTERSFEV